MVTASCGKDGGSIEARGATGEHGSIFCYGGSPFFLQPTATASNARMSAACTVRRIGFQKTGFHSEHILRGSSLGRAWTWRCPSFFRTTRPKGYDPDSKSARRCCSLCPRSRLTSWPWRMEFGGRSPNWRNGNCSPLGMRLLSCRQERIAKKPASQPDPSWQTHVIFRFLVWDDRPPIHGGIFSASNANTISYSNQGTEESQQDAKIRVFSQTVGRSVRRR
jgi:hypothetical protein